MFEYQPCLSKDMSIDKNTLTDFSKRRDTLEKSIKLGQSIAELEYHPSDTDCQEKANLFASLLDSLCQEYKTLHYSILSFYNEQDDLD